ncbi:hypothetical protein [Rhizobium aethiopicum]|uniref:Uncharacterized protein n=1 Tax=Rhizobium aethiopicum TaxID=1138170 RepID=A0A7W6MHR9_9HYPH|nr:hypothetical protein [Rhizobium aethiopicum]MBB4192757.1 hypothetical protein [Rhizobium aethiopicum]
MGWPQITIISLSAIGVGINAAKHGQRREGKHNLWIALAVVAAEMYVLHAGGFFN